METVLRARLPSTTARLAAALALAAAGCNDSLVDRNANPALLHGNCQPTQAVCGDVCVAEDAGHCGATCADCTAASLPDPNAVGVCASHACGFECNPGFLRNGDACRRATAVAAGFAHTCALLSDGAVRCWGANEHGQLGDGSRNDSGVPVAVALPASATAVAAGFVHTCAVAGGAVYCWGDNSTGALGDGTTTGRPSPASVTGVSGATAIAAGGGENVGAVVTFYGHSCAIASGRVWCWGGNESGQLGDGTFTPRPTPVQVADLTTQGTATSIAVGDRHTCAVVGGAVWCWGLNGAGELGNGGTTNEAHPQQAIASGATQVAAGAVHSCAVGGGLSCWGDNSEGQSNAGVSSPATEPTPNPVALPGPAPSSASAGRAHTCGLVPGTSDGLVCFGANDTSQLGSAASARGLVAVTLAPAQAVAAGYDYTCALLTNGGVQCWGANDRGQLGTGAPGPAAPAAAYVSGR
jgi:alpha-tubulin suppressor-like RCC1 family protein